MFFKIRVGQSLHDALHNSYFILVLSAFCLFLPLAAYGGVVDTTLYRAVDTELSGNRAFKDVEYFTQFWRIPGGPAFDECLAYTLEQLALSGFSDRADTPAWYWIDEEPIVTPVWIPEGGELRMVKPDKKTLHTYEQTPVLLCVNSFPTSVTADVVFVGSGTRSSDYRKVDVKDKIVLGRGAPKVLYRRAVRERGALGIISGHIQGFNRPNLFPDAIHDGEIPYDPDRKSFGMMVSTRTVNLLMRQLQKGEQVRVRAKIQSSFTPGIRRTLVAEIPGMTKPAERIVLVGHIDHYKPGANDNAAGAATVLEIARTIAALIERGEVPPPDRTITFLWVDEYEGTTLWMQRHPEAVRNIHAAFVLDMVGEKTEVTGGAFQVERMPDPSSIWLRPPDEHTPWGAGAVDHTDIRGHFLNDFYLSVCRQRADATGWVVRTNPWEGGSDHDLFLKRGLPAILNWHFPDYFYHTSLDDIDKVSPDEMKHVGVAAATAVLTLATASNETALRILDTVEASVVERFDNEERNSREAMAAVREKEQLLTRQQAEEEDILSAWGRWYEETLESLAGVPVEGGNDVLLGRIADAKQRVRQRLASILAELTSSAGEE